VIEKLRGLRLSRAAELVEMAVEETLAYYAFPEEHWRRIRSARESRPLSTLFKKSTGRRRCTTNPRAPDVETCKLNGAIRKPT